MPLVTSIRLKMPPFWRSQLRSDYFKVSILDLTAAGGSLHCLLFPTKSLRLLLKNPFITSNTAYVFSNGIIIECCYIQINCYTVELFFLYFAVNCNYSVIIFLVRGISNYHIVQNLGQNKHSISSIRYYTV